MDPIIAETVLVWMIDWATAVGKVDSTGAVCALDSSLILELLELRELVEEGDVKEPIIGPYD